MTRALLLGAALCLAAVLPLRAEDPAAVEQRMRQQLRRHPGDLDARHQLARVLSWQSRFREAAAEFSRLLAARPGNADFLLGLAQVRLWSGAPAQALPLLQKARRLAPDYEDVWRTEIQALLAGADAARLREARQLRDAARARFPRSAWTFARLDPVPAAPAAPAPLPAPVAVADAARTPTLPQVPKPEPATPAPPAAVPDSLWEAGLSHEVLTRGQPAWRSRYLTGAWRLADGRSLYGGLRDTERYALKDREAHVGGSLAVAGAVQLQFEAGFSDSHRVLPAHYLSAGGQFQPAPGWELAAGVRRSRYDAGASRVAHLGVDRYFGSERLGYTLYEGGPAGSSLSPSHRVQWAHHYGERDWVAVALNRGRETENTGSAGFLTAQVRGVSLSGHHNMAPDWALVWEVGTHRQGEFYTRNGARLGLRHSF